MLIILQFGTETTDDELDLPYIILYKIPKMHNNFSVPE